jgi:hypothetical protein
MNKKLLLSLSLICAGTPHESSAAFPFVPLVTVGVCYGTGVVGSLGGIGCVLGYYQQKKDFNGVWCGCKGLIREVLLEGNFLSNLGHLVSPLILFGAAQKAAYSLSPWGYLGMGAVSGVTSLVGLTFTNDIKPKNKKSAAQLFINIAPAALYAAYILYPRK